jgi:hypothetical protein
MLNAELEQYELKIQHYEYLYEQELATFQSKTYRTESPYQISHLSELMYFVKVCLSSYKTFFTSNSLQRIMFSCQITMSAPTPQISISKQND